MSQYRQSNSTAAADAGISPDADTLVESYAEDLMDEIFDDVDRILEGDESAIYAEPSVQDYESSASPLFSADAVTIPAMIVPVTTEKSVEPIPVKGDAEAKAPSTTSPSPTKPPKKKPWGVIMLGVACVSALTAAGIWKLQQQAVLQTAGPVIAPTVSEEVAFGEYLKRSLQVISGERSAQVDSQNPSAVATAPSRAGENKDQQGRSPGVIERVFVPLLQPSNSAVQKLPSPEISSQSAPLPAPNVGAPSAAPQTNSADGAAVTNPVPNIAVVSTYELVGVLELGDRSAALFDVNGTSQRVYIGETIGGSGWSIVSIANEEVVVRRNGEVRSIYIGQQF